jgi:ribA/ribD-fused uncharacterized protein
MNISSFFYEKKMYFNIVNYHQYNREMADEPKIDEPKIDEPKIDEPEIDEPEIDEPKIDEPEIDVPKIVFKDLDDEKEGPYKEDLKNFYREIKEQVKCGSYCSKLQGFYRAKAKAKDINGDTYGYDADGNLVEKAKGAVVKTIALPIYRPATAEEMDEMEKEHARAIALANRELDDARSALYTMSQNPERDPSTMVRLNRAVMEADCKLCVVRFPLMYTSKETGIKIRQLDFTQPTETRGLPYAVAIIQTRPFPLQEQYVRIGEPAAKPFVSVAEAKNIIKEAAGVPIIVFEGADSNEYGYLSMEWAVVIEYNSSTYQSVYQAIYSELAKSFDDQKHLPQLLAAETADEISYSVEDVPGGDLEQNKEKWNEQIRKLIYDVNLVKFRRYPELASKLLETKNAMIGAYEPGDNMIGIGISIENMDSKDPAKWGENLLGKSLMNIRELLRSEQPVPSIKKRKPPVSSATAATAPVSVRKRASAAASNTVPISSKEASITPQNEAPAQDMLPLQNVSTSEPATAAVSAPALVPAPVSGKRKPRVGSRVNASLANAL